MTEDVAARLLALPPEQRRRVLRAISERAGGSGPAPLPRDQLPARFPASPNQESQWFLWRLAPRSAAYHVPFCYDLTGEIDVAALSGALSALVERHEALRTTFAHDTDVQQVVGPARRYALAVISAPDREAALAQVTRQAMRPFDLRTGPVLRVGLWCYSPGRHLLLLVFHHIAVDAVSTAILERELPVLYAAERAGTTAALPDLPLQYADLAARRTEADTRYWRDRLAGAPRCALPTDRPRPPVASTRGDTVTVEVPAADAVAALAAQWRATRFTVLFAAFAACLRGITGEDDLTIGTPVAGRDQPAAEGVVGYFLNLLALRITTPADATFRELVDAAKDAVTGGLKHQGASFADVVRAVDAPTPPGRNPLFDILFTVVTEDDTAPDWPDLTVTPVLLPHHGAQFDLAVTAVESPGRLRLSLQYASELFDRDRVVGWAEELVRIITVGTRTQL